MPTESVIKRSLIGILTAVIIGFIGLLIYYHFNKPDSSIKDEILPISISSGRYPEFLKKSLNIELELEDRTAWIFLTNKSSEPIPAEEPHRAIVCTIEISDETGKLIGSYPEYFKPLLPSEIGMMPSRQIPPKETVKIGYDLTTTHGIVRVIVTYEDFSKTLTGGSAKLLLYDKEIKF